MVTEEFDLLNILRYMFLLWPQVKLITAQPVYQIDRFNPPIFGLNRCVFCRISWHLLLILLCAGLMGCFAPWTYWCFSWTEDFWAMTPAVHGRCSPKKSKKNAATWLRPGILAVWCHPSSRLFGRSVGETDQFDAVAKVLSSLVIHPFKSFLFYLFCYMTSGPKKGYYSTIFHGFPSQNVMFIASGRIKATFLTRSFSWPRPSWYWSDAEVSSLSTRWQAKLGLADLPPAPAPPPVPETKAGTGVEVTGARAPKKWCKHV